MVKYLVQTIIGAFLVDENGQTIKSSLAKKSIDDNVEEILRFEEGHLPSSMAKLISELDKNDEYVVESESLSKMLTKEGFTSISVKRGAEAFRAFRARLPQLAVELGFVKSEEEYQKYVHDFLIEHTRRKLREVAQKRDLLAAQAIRAIDDLDKTFNLFAIRLREWYSVHFPELDELVPKHEQYIKLVFELGHRENFTVEELERLEIPRQKAEKIAEAARKSIGADLSDFDVEPMRIMARMALEMYELRRRLTEYIDAVMREVAPNITAIVGSLLGARLISLAGSLEELARLPASTIQVLGAEKALFRALRTGGKPPKHGVIFQYPDIHKSPRWQRGKIARALAGKLSIAAKVDAFTGRFIGDKLVEDLRERIEEIKKLYVKPPVRKPETAAAPPRPKKAKERSKKKKK
uniref:C/D box methylation guide ribonucleoprotein complex aNOP56 subunit n=1 Tax=Fervidicoccus fontis TaxID=683846 RepID=A0A7J3ZKC8_9CREN